MLRKILHQNLFRIVLGLVFCTITYLAFTPRHHAVAEQASDKINHLLAFFTLALLVDGSFQPWQSRWFLKILSVLGYGVLIEVVQLGLSYRSFSLLDLIADAVGIGLYSVPAILFFRMTAKVSKE